MLSSVSCLFYSFITSFSPCPLPAVPFCVFLVFPLFLIPSELGVKRTVLNIVSLCWGGKLSGNISYFSLCLP